VLVSVAVWTGSLPDSVVERLVLHSSSPLQLVGHLFLHAGIFHLVGNMIFLWVFGNAICSNTSNALYALIFFSCGVAAGAVHMIADGHPAVGASGAINGIVGLTLAIYPLNRVSVFWTFLVRGGTFSVRAYGIIIFWFIFDLWGALEKGGEVAYWAHIGGFLFGLISGLLLLKLKFVETTEWDNPTLLDLTGFGEKQRRD
jgi:membrane associated rhomboid family serine protease